MSQHASPTHGNDADHPHGKPHQEMQEVGGISMAYFVVFALLLILLFATVDIAFRTLGPFGPVIAMAIATTKAVLVVLFFMHVKHASKLTWIFAGAGLLWLAILFGLTFGDYMTRSWNDAVPATTHEAQTSPFTGLPNQ